MPSLVNAFPRNVLVTGASSGLGRALSLWFAHRGARVWAAARRRELLETLAVDPTTRAGAIVPVMLDVSDVAAIRRVLSELDDQAESGLDVVIANAGVGGEANPRKDTWEKVEQMIQVNVTGAAATLATLAPRMAERGRGHLVGISSLAAWMVTPKMGAYSATKMFLEVYCEGLHLDLKGVGVAVTCINPGFVKSEMTAKNKFKMPFLLEADDAADRMGRAILRREKRFAYPWPMVLATRAARLVPDAVVARVMGKSGVRPASSAGS
jgi:short-subunit dehydrogenase